MHALANIQQIVTKDPCKYHAHRHKDKSKRTAAVSKLQLMTVMGKACMGPPPLGWLTKYPYYHVCMLIIFTKTRMKGLRLQSCS